MKVAYGHRPQAFWVKKALAPSASVASAVEANFFV